MKKFTVLLLVWVLMALAGCYDSSNDSDTSENDSSQGAEATWESLATPIVADGHALDAPLVDFLPDGRMVVVEGGSATEIEIAVEEAAGSLSFSYVTSLVPGDEFSYGSFVKALDNATVVVGASTIIYLVDLSAGTSEILTEIDNFDAALNGNDLYVTRMTYNADWSYNGYVTRIDLADPDAPVDVITGIPGASAGVCLDDGGNLYTGNGYSNAGVDETGLIKRFDLSSAPLDWSAGTSCGDILSAGTLIWVGGGMMLVGGGDTFGSGDDDYFALLYTDSAATVLQFDPDAAANSNYKLSAGAGRFAASVWDYATSSGTIYLMSLADILE